MIILAHTSVYEDFLISKNIPSRIKSSRKMTENQGALDISCVLVGYNLVMFLVCWITICSLITSIEKNVESSSKTLLYADR